jgi:sulfopyruvate decarboxylase TPP-binding subunit
MQRFECLKAIAPKLKDELVIANLANTATEWRAVRPHEGNLYFVGMGMVTPYAIGLALALPHRPVLALDGDGGILFEMSVLGTLAQTAPKNLCVVVLDNEGYVSTGKWSSAASLSRGPVDIAAVASGCGIENVTTARTVDEFVAAVEAGLADDTGPSVIVAKTDESQAFVGTSLMDGRENKYRFVRHIEQLEGTTILKPSAREHGEPPKPDPVFSPVTPDDTIAEVLFDGLRENEVDFVIGLPCSGYAAAQARCMDDQSMRYVGVANEGTGFGICAGAWLGGKRPAAVVENFGFFAGIYQLLRGHYTMGIPLLLVSEYRGDAGETEFFGDSGDMTEPLLQASRINHRLVRDLGELKPAIRDGLRWMNFALRPYCVLPSFDLTRPRPAAK